MMNDRERRDLAELREYYNDMEKRIQRIRHLCKFSKDRISAIKYDPAEKACVSSMYSAFYMCLQILNGYSDEED